MNKRVLIIDEDINTLHLIDVRLSKVGFETSLARDGEEGLAQAQQQRPNLVIMDSLLAKIDGPALIGRLKSEFESAPLVLVLSHKNRDEDFAAAFAAGADDYLCKPFSPLVLQERVRINLIKAGHETSATKEE